MDKKITCNILTPDNIVFEGNVDYAVVPAHDGEMGFLFNHAPLVAELGVGEVKLTNNLTTERIVVHGGFVEIRDNEITVLAEAAFKKQQIDVENVKQKLEALVNSQMPTDYDERCRIELEIKKLKVSLKLAESK